MLSKGSIFGSISRGFSSSITDEVGRMVNKTLLRGSLSTSAEAEDDLSDCGSCGTCGGCGIDWLKEEEDLMEKTKKNINTLSLTDFSKVPAPSSFKSSWSYEKEQNVPVPKATDIIQHDAIEKALAATKDAAKDKSHVREIFKHAKDAALLKDGIPGGEFVQGLDLMQTATLLNIPDDDYELLEELFKTAYEIKDRIYGNRIVLFAPLYLSNHCVCSCKYCGYRGENTDIERSSLTNEQLKKEVEALQRIGHRRLLLLTGESPRYTFDQFLDALEVTANTRTKPHGQIRRTNVEIPPISISDFRRLKKSDSVGTYTVFQETYHRPTYQYMHPYGPKAHYDFRLQTMDRAQIGGMDDVGIGALLGLYDYKYEILAMLQHSQHLDKTYNAGPHTISIPRIQYAAGGGVSENPPHPVSDIQFMKLAAIIRLSVPYTGMILSTRESVSLRNKMLHLGISQMSAGSKTNIGAYSEEEDTSEKMEKNNMMGQFSLQDDRNLDEIVYSLMKDGFVPSFCTACYRLGRTGEKFMKIAKKGEIHNMCGPNALVTLAEYLMDYATPEVQDEGWKVIQREKQTLSPRAQGILDKYLQRMKFHNERDLYV